MTRDRLAEALAGVLLDGPWEPLPASWRLRDAVAARRTPPWATALTTEVLAAYRDAPHGRRRELAAFLPTTRAWRRPALHRVRIVALEPRTSGAPVRPVFVPDLAVLPETVGELAAWLGLPPGDLDWFCDIKSLLSSAPGSLQHYRVTVVPKPGGVRILEAPKPRLKALQRRVLSGLVGLIPPHAAAHGGVPGHSVRTALQPHGRRGVLLRIDLEAFFATVTAGRVFGTLAAAGLADGVAHALTGLLTTTLPTTTWRSVPRPAAADLPAHERLRWALRRPHLPQGAPTSPAVANLVAFNLDRRLTSLAAAFDATYTRYVDDLVFSADRLPVAVFRRAVADIVVDSGWRVADRKTVVLRAAQSQRVLGTVANVRPGVPRRERDRLRAILHNCTEGGVASQRGEVSADEFRAQLAGRIAWIGGVNPSHGRRLQQQFDRIDWATA